MNGTNNKVPHFGAFFTPVLIPLRLKCSNQKPVYKYP